MTLTQDQLDYLRSIMSKLPVLEAELKANPSINMAMPGRMKTVLDALSPSDVDELTKGATRYDHEVELGHHGDPDWSANQMGVDKDVAKRIWDGYSVDYVTQALELRGSDAMRPEEPISRRDQLDAAFMAHGIKE